ncbi:MAG: ATP-binding cassette domain-containing protein [Rhodobacteraceae bacterium]|nr:ATP-binding cassette domain-containing protein [Paracoccaceae bacterium]
MDSRQEDDGAGRMVAGIAAALILFGIASNLLMLGGPLFMLVVYDIVLPAGSSETLVVLLLALAVAQVAQTLLDIARMRTLSRIGARWRQALIPAAFDGRATAASAGVGTGAALQAFLGSASALAVLDLPFLPMMLGALFLFHPAMGWLACTGMVALAGLAALERQLAAGPGKHLEQASTLAAVDLSRDRGRTRPCCGLRCGCICRWRRRQGGVGRQISLGDRVQACTAAARGIRVFLQSGALGLGAWLAIRGELTGGAMVAGTLLMSRILGPFDQALTAVPQALRLWQAQAGLRQPADRRPPARSLAARIELRGVTVEPAPGQCPPLHQICLSVGPGQILLVLGQSGAGKSMLLRVIAGLHPCGQGQVEVGHVTVRPGSRPPLCIGYLPERLAFASGTVAEAVAGGVGDDAAIRTAARKAARAAGVESAVLALPQGFETPISQAEEQLPGGMLARLSLARALAGDPSLLLLDCPEVAHDPEGLATLAAVLRSARARGAAVILTARDPRALALADHLVLLERGRARACGPVAKVIADLGTMAAEAEVRAARSHAGAA